MRHRLARAGILLAFVTGLAACGQASQLAEGVVIAVENGAAPLQVAAFTLRSDDGQILAFEIGQLEIDRGSFDAAHLRVHQLTGLPIIVAYHDQGGTFVAYRLVDRAAAESLALVPSPSAAPGPDEGIGRSGQTCAPPLRPGRS